MEAVRYVLVLLVVGWGGGLLGGIAFALLLPLFSRLRGRDLGRLISAMGNGLSTMGAVILAYALCGKWTGEPPSLAMFGLAFLALMSNDSWRGRRAQAASSIGGVSLAADPEMRRGFVLTERLNHAFDFVGFAVGMILIPTLSFF